MDMAKTINSDFKHLQLLELRPGRFCNMSATQDWIKLESFPHQESTKKLLAAALLPLMKVWGVSEVADV